MDATRRKIKKLSDQKAADLGYVGLLKDRRSRGLLKSYERTFVCAAAARSGQLEELKALRAASFPWDATTCAFAAQGGHLEVLKWARANGCPWNEWTCTGAANGGHLEILQWARENGCPWDEKTIAWAFRQGHLEMVKWALANGAPLASEMERCLKYQDLI